MPRRPVSVVLACLLGLAPAVPAGATPPLTHPVPSAMFPNLPRPTHPGIGAISGPSGDTSTLAPGRTYIVTGVEFGSGDGNLYLTSDKPDRRACDLQTLRLQLEASLWTDREIRFATPKPFPPGVTDSCDAVLVVQRAAQNGLLPPAWRHDVTLSPQG